MDERSGDAFGDAFGRTRGVGVAAKVGEGVSLAVEETAAARCSCECKEAPRGERGGVLPAVVATAAAVTALDATTL